jgi:hypothetical protein
MRDRTIATRKKENIELLPVAFQGEKERFGDTRMKP